jgi:hypothetical protein
MTNYGETRQQKDGINLEDFYLDNDGEKLRKKFPFITGLRRESITNVGQKTDGKLIIRQGKCGISTKFDFKTTSYPEHSFPKRVINPTYSNYGFEDGTFLISQDCYTDLRKSEGFLVVLFIPDNTLVIYDITKCPVWDFNDETVKGQILVRIGTPNEAVIDKATGYETS